MPWTSRAERRAKVPLDWSLPKRLVAAQLDPAIPRLFKEIRRNLLRGRINEAIFGPPEDPTQAPPLPDWLKERDKRVSALVRERARRGLPVDQSAFSYDLLDFEETRPLQTKYAAWADKTTDRGLSSLKKEGFAVREGRGYVRVESVPSSLLEAESQLQAVRHALSSTSTRKWDFSESTWVQARQTVYRMLADLDGEYEKHLGRLVWDSTRYSRKELERSLKGGSTPRGALGARPSTHSKARRTPTPR